YPASRQVSLARRNGLQSTNPNCRAARNCPSAAALRSPAGVRGISVRPVCRLAALHSVSPCRINQSSWCCSLIHLRRMTYSPLHFHFWISHETPECDTASRRRQILRLEPFRVHPHGHGENSDYRRQRRLHRCHTARRLPVAVFRTVRGG